jgi:hypothetical protein
VDWNSFFSTISQASASMIGVILAFLVSRIINEGSDYDRLLYDWNSLIDESLDLKARMDSINFEWHDDKIFEDLDFTEVEADLINLEDGTSEDKAEFIRSISPRLYYPARYLRQLEAKINAAVRPPKASSDRLSGNLRFSPIDIPVRGFKMPVPGLWERVRAIEDEFDNISLRIQSVVRRHKSMARAFSRNMSDMNSLSISVLALSPITILTVIYPLHFLPVPNGTNPSLSFSLLVTVKLLISLKGFFLMVLSILTIGLLLFLAYHCKRHASEYRKKIKVINDTYVDLAWYSDLIKSYNPFILSPEDPFANIEE